MLKTEVWGRKKKEEKEKEKKKNYNGKSIIIIVPFFFSDSIPRLCQDIYLQASQNTYKLL